MGHPSESAKARFEILRSIGEGGMGSVYEARDTSTGATVALKFLKQLSGQALYRFKREFRLVGELEHPNLVELGELFGEGDAWFFSMEYVEGVDLLTHVRGASAGFCSSTTEPLVAGHISSTQERPLLREAQGEVDLARLYASMSQLALALATLHELGIVHRDVKPSNVRVTPAGRTVLLDFGIVASARESTAGDAQVLGTAAYMAPEQARGEASGPEVDWYALGATLFELLTGRLPFSGSSLQMLLDKQQLEVRRPSAFSEGVPPELDELCARLLRREPGERPKAAEVLACLRGEHPALPEGVRLREPFVGRRAELEFLRSARHHARERTSVVCVEGQPGIGKTALVERFLDELPDDALVLRARCYERESVPFKGFDGIVDDLSRFLCAVDGRDAARLLGSDGPNVARLFPVLERVPVVAELKRVERAEAVDPGERRQRAFFGLGRMLSRLSHERALVLFIDDLQWSDSESAALLDVVLAPELGGRFLLVATSRPSETRPLRDARTVTLLGLADHEARRLLGRYGGSFTPEGDAVVQAQGHPLLLKELVQRAQHAPANAALNDLLRARVAELDADARSLVEHLAVAGAPLSPPQLARALGRDLPRVQELLRSLRLKKLARTERDAFVLFHDRTRESVVESLSDARTRTLHARLADALAPDASVLALARRLVGHLLGAGETHRAAERALRAAQLADQQLAFEAAADLYALALARGELTPEREREVAERTASSYWNAGHGAEAARYFLRAAERSEGLERLAFQRSAAEALLLTGHMDEGLEISASVLAEAGAAGPSSRLVTLLMIPWFRLLIRLRGLGFRVRDASQVSPVERLKLSAYQLVAFDQVMIDPARAARFQLAYLLLAMRLGDPDRVLEGLSPYAGLLAYEATPAAFRRADHIMSEARALADRFPSESSEAQVLGGRAAVEYSRGNFELSRSLAVGCRERLPLRHEKRHGVRSTMNMYELWSLLWLGRFDELVPRLAEVQAEATHRNDRFLLADLVSVSCVTYAAADQPERALADIAAVDWADPARGFHVQHFFLTIARAQTALYTGAAFDEDLRRDVHSLERSLQARFSGYVRAETGWLHGRLLAAYGTESELGRLRSLVGRARSTGAPLFEAWSAMLACSAAARTEPKDVLLRKLETAAALCERQGMAVLSASARLRLAQVRADAAQVREAEQALSARGIRMPGRFVSLYLPGFQGFGQVR